MGETQKQIENYQNNHIESDTMSVCERRSRVIL